MELKSDIITLIILVLIILNIDSTDAMCPDIVILLLLTQCYLLFVGEYTYIWNRMSFMHNQCYLMSII